MILFNKPYRTENELTYISKVLETGRVSGDGFYTNEVKKYFLNKYSFKNILLTTSCTDALEMCAILLRIKPNDEVIIPSYTFVSTALPFVMAGATIKFCDSQVGIPHQSYESIRSLISNKTKAIVVVHYAGAVVDLERIQSLCKEKDIFLIEDAAQAIDSFYNGQPAGSFGDLATFSFHESKNITSGEGGLLVVKDPLIAKRAEIIREKGTNRSEFFRGEVNKYGWVDVGSSYLPSDILAAYLYSQLECLDEIQSKRIRIWNYYYNELQTAGFEYALPKNIPGHNAHIFWLMVPNRDLFISNMKELGVHVTSHYQSLHKSKYFSSQYIGPDLINADLFTDCLVRLPLYPSLTDDELALIVKHTIASLELIKES